MRTRIKSYNKDFDDLGSPRESILLISTSTELVTMYFLSDFYLICFGKLLYHPIYYILSCRLPEEFLTFMIEWLLSQSFKARCWIKIRVHQGWPIIDSVYCSIGSIKLTIIRRHYFFESRMDCNSRKYIIMIKLFLKAQFDEPLS